MGIENNNSKDLDSGLENRGGKIPFDGDLERARQVVGSEPGEIWIIKAGSSLVTHGGEGVDRARLYDWARQISTLRSKGVKVIFVTSGSIAEGICRLGWKEKPKEINKLQAAAAVGQMSLIQAYKESFQNYGMRTAQILLTHDDLSNRTRYLNARATLKTLIDMDIVPIINENDTVTTAEIKLSDNDTLGALVANLVEAHALVILTDQKGLYDSDPRSNPDAKFIHEALAENEALEAMAGGAGTMIGTGGMATKVRAAKRAALSGTFTFIAGNSDDALLRIHNHDRVGTLLIPGQSRRNAREQWILGQLRLKGSLVVDEGCRKALATHKSSLLAIGVTKVEGEFHRGELVAIVDSEGNEIARGLANYSSEEAGLLVGEPSSKIGSILGYVAEEELVHRDNMVLRV